MGLKDILILIVDDMVTMRALVKRSLSSMGFYNFKEACDGELAWQVIQEAEEEGNPISVIVADINMPKMRGIDLLQKVRLTKNKKELPFIFLTSENDIETVTIAIESGANSYITKPFTNAKLQEEISKVFQISTSS